MSHGRNTFLKSNQITKETRFISYIQRPTTRQEQILKVLEKSDGMISRQIAQKLGYSHPQAVRPRLTELKEKGYIEVVGVAQDMVTGKNVAVWRVKEI